MNEWRESWAGIVGERVIRTRVTTRAMDEGYMGSLAERERR